MYIPLKTSCSHQFISGIQNKANLTKNWLYIFFSLLTDKILKVPKHFLYTTYSVSYTLAFPSLKNLPLIKIRTTVRLSDSYSSLKYV